MCLREPDNLLQWLSLVQEKYFCFIPFSGPLVRMTRLNNQRPLDGAGHLSISFDDGSYSNRGLLDCWKTFAKSFFLADVVYYSKSLSRPNGALLEIYEPYRQQRPRGQTAWDLFLRPALALHSIGLSIKIKSTISSPQNSISSRFLGKEKKLLANDGKRETSTFWSSAAVNRNPVEKWQSSSYLWLDPIRWLSLEKKKKRTAQVTNKSYEPRIETNYFK